MIHTAPTFLVAIFSILLSVAAQFSLKSGMSSTGIKAALGQPFSVNTLISLATNCHLIIGFGLYGLGAIVWLSVLSKWDVSKAYPLVGLGFVVTMLVGYILGEQIGWERILGCSLICVGIYLISRS
jgi:multidrug transporter EmrE-like cation transporter